MEPAGLSRRCSNLHISAIFLLIIMLTEYVAQAQRVITEPEGVVLVEGQKTSLLCRLGVPINYCRIAIPGEEKVLVLSDQWDKTPGFTYNGAGLQAGQCGVTIDRVSARNHGQVKCSLGVEGEELSGVIDLIVALPPLRPEIDVLSGNRGGSFEVDQPLRARCVIRDGRPAANITWFLNDEPIYQGLGQQEISENHDHKRNTTLYTTMQEIQRHIAADDNGKFLICRATHIGDSQNNEGRLQLMVSYGPQPLQDVKVYGLTLGTTAMVTVTIFSNPRPRIQWTVDGLDIPQGTQNGRYEAYEPVELGNGAYNVSLSIAGLTQEDTMKDYYLRASNDFGSQDYTVRISSLNTPVSQGLDIGAIVGIVVAIAVLLIVVLLIIFARATGRWCFSAKSSKPPTSETDTESAELKSTKTRKLPSFEAIFKRKSDKSKIPPKEIIEPQNVDEQRLANVTMEPKEGEDGNGNEPKEDKQLVYAELVLKPSDDKPVPPRNATEYAEIVYVQKQGQEGTDQPKESKQSSQ